MTTSANFDPTSTVRVLLVDDHPVVRAGLRAMLSEDPGIEVLAEAADGTAALVKDAVDRGAVVRAGGSAIEGPGTFFEPTVITEVAAGSDILREEIFGPVLAIATFADEDEAVRLANDTEYGLVSYVFTEDLQRGLRMIDRLETGMMGLNIGVVSNAAAPFGGVKQSGVGREGGLEGIHEYLSTKYTLIPAS